MNTTHEPLDAPCGARTPEPVPIERCAAAVLLAALLLALPGAAAGQAADSVLVGSWEGAAETPGGPMGLGMDLALEGGDWSGTFRIPAEGVEVPLSRVRTVGDSVVLPLAPGRELRGIVRGDSIRGALEIQGRAMPVTLGRVGSVTAERIAGEVRAVAEASRPAPLVLTDRGDGLEGVDSAALNRLVEAANLAHSHSLVVLRDGDLVGAWHAGGVRRLIETMSITKSVLNLAIGRLLTIGAIESVDEPVHAYFPAWREGGRSAITLRHLLDHTSGIASPMPTAPIYESEDFVNFALDAEQVAAPGTEFLYNNNATNLLAGLAGRAAGERLDRFLARDLFAHLGIDDFRWSLDGAGNPHGMSGAQMHAEDLAKLGQLVLRRGNWDGEQLIDEAWFDQSLRPGSPLRDDAGFLWWLIREDEGIVGYRADGYLGQYLVVYPSEGLVAVRLVGQTPAYDPETDGFRDFPSLVKELVREGRGTR